MEEEDTIAELLVRIHRIYLYPFSRFLYRFVCHWAALLRYEPTSSFVESREYKRKVSLFTW